MSLTIVHKRSTCLPWLSPTNAPRLSPNGAQALNQLRPNHTVAPSAVFPVLCISASSFLHILFGLPLIYWPCPFQRKYPLVMLFKNVHNLNPNLIYWTNATSHSNKFIKLIITWESLQVPFWELIVFLDHIFWTAISVKTSTLIIYSLIFFNSSQVSL